jgi:hypothetical protein
MYILNNIHDRQYRNEHPDISNVVFDISEKQIKNVKNSDWNTIKEGSIVCVIKSSRKISTFFVVDSLTNTATADQKHGEIQVLTGRVIAKLASDENMTTVLNRHGVTHPHLPKNKFGAGLCVANIGNGLDDLPVKIAGGETNLGDVIASHA